MITSKAQSTSAFDMRKFMQLMRSDKNLKHLDLDAFEKRFTQRLAEHGPMLDELSRHDDELFAERIRSCKHDDPEVLLERLLQRELRETGVDWRRFAAGKQDEHDAADRHFKQLGLPFTARDLMSRKISRDANNTDADSGEFVTARDADAAAGYRGSSVKTFVTQRASRYSEIKNAAMGNNFLGAVAAMMAGGIMGFGTQAAGAASHAMSAGGAIGTAIAAGIEIIGLPAVGLVAAAVYAFIFIFALVFGEAHILTAIINRTPFGLLVQDTYQLHGDSPLVPTAMTTNYNGINQVSAGQQVDIAGVGSMIFIGYYYQSGDIGFVGVNGAYKVTLAPGANDPNQSTGLPSGQHIYIGHAIEKIGSSYIRADITGDASAQSYYTNHGFSASDSAASSGPISVTARLNDYPSSWGAKNVFELVFVHAPARG